MYGLTYIDHNTKTVFNGSDIGKDYSAKGLMERFNVHEQTNIGQQPQKIVLNPNKTDEESVAGEKKQGLEIALKELLDPIKQSDYLPRQLRQKKKKRKSPGMRW